MLRSAIHSQKWTLLMFEYGVVVSHALTLFLDFSMLSLGLHVAILFDHLL